MRTTITIPVDALEPGDTFTQACGDLAGLIVTGVDVVNKGVAVGLTNDVGSPGAVMFQHGAAVEVER